MIMNKNKIKSTMRKNLQHCRDSFTREINYTLLAEMTAADLNLYVGHDQEIPEIVFELALEFS